MRAPEPGFARLAALAYTEIALYGADSPQVSRRLLAAYGVLEGLTDGPRREAVADLRRRTLAAVEAAMPAAFLEVAREPDRLGFGLTTPYLSHASSACAVRNSYWFSRTSSTASPASSIAST